MFKPIKKDPTTEEVSKVVNILFSKLDPKERDRIINLVDEFMIYDLQISEQDIPWLNKDKQNLKNYRHLLDMIRLSLARLLGEYDKLVSKNKLN
jgi:hypothetical protein